jgi:hypothetical protein
MTSSRNKLGLYVSRSCRAASPHGKGWFEFRLFAKKFWRLLSTYTLLVSESTAGILEEVSRDLRESEGVEVRWDLDIYPKPNSIVSLVNKLVASSREEVERILVFLDPQAPAELESLFVLREAIAQHGQKLHINLGAPVWAEREWKAVLGLESKSLIAAGDAIVLLGQKHSLKIDRFALTYFEKVLLFPNFVIPVTARSMISELLKTVNSPASLPRTTCGETPELASLLFANYFNTGGGYMDRRLCHVVICPGSNRARMQRQSMEEFISMCADPRLRINLMLNKETAEEWIQQPFERANTQVTIQ